MPDESMPRRPRTHVVGTRALAAFEHSAPGEWVLNRSESDYGWDIYIEITSGDRLTALSFFCQLKGSDSPDYISNESALSQSLKVTTVEFLHSKGLPAMLAVCDTHKSGEPVFWVWLDNAIQELETQNPNWHQQESVTLHIPTANQLTRTSGVSIQNDVDSFLANRRVKMDLFDMLAAGQQVVPRAINITAELAEQKVVATTVARLSSAGLVDVQTTEAGEVIKGLSEADAAILEKLKEVHVHLSKLRDHDADQLLRAIAPQVATSAAPVTARFHNSQGVLHLHLRQHQAAKESFARALELRGSEAKYRTNSLFTRLLMAVDDEIPEIQRDAQTLLSSHPAYSPAIRVNAYVIARTESPEAAEQYLRGSSAWSVDAELTRTCAAEILKSGGKNEKALDLLLEVEALNATQDGAFWALRGSAHLSLALNDASSDAETTVHGYGPSNIQLQHLKQAYECYQRAIKDFAQRGFPSMSETAILNYATVAELLGLSSEVERICLQFLQFHQTSKVIQAALAASLLHQDKANEALAYTRSLYQSEPTSTTIFKNLAVTLLVAEEFDELASIIEERASRGFTDVEEEGLARALAAIAYSEVGDVARATTHLAALQGRPELAGRASMAEAEVILRTTRDKAAAASVYRNAVLQHPDDVLLLTQFAMHLGSPRPETAQEIADILGRVATFRELAPEEYLAIIKSYLILRDGQRALEWQQKGIARFSNNRRIAFAEVAVLEMLGDTGRAYEKIRAYLHSDKSYSALLDAAHLAKEVGRLDEAIHFLEYCSRRAERPEDRGRIHIQLYALKRLRGDPAKEILRHAYEFGKTAGDDPEKESQYFIMFLMAPVGPADAEDIDVKSWAEDAKARIQAFAAKYPSFQAFRVLSFDPSRPVMQQLQSALSDIIAATLPRELAASTFRVAARNAIWPLPLRARIYPEAHGSLFRLWSICTSNENFAYGIHIWSQANNSSKEIEAAVSARAICIDLTGLLTLAHFDLLEAVSDTFSLIVISHGTKRTLMEETLRLDGPHPLAQKIDQWRAAHIRKIRVKDGRPARLQEPPISTEGINGPEQPASLHELLRYGVGETVLLAEHMGLPFYCDDSAIRGIADNEYRVTTFSTLAFVHRLVVARRVPEFQNVVLMTQMIKANFHSIPFGAVHLTIALRHIIESEPDISTSEQLKRHPILGVLLGQFAEATVTVESLSVVAVEWWLAILFEPDIPYRFLVECMEGPSYSLVMWRTIGGVLSRIPDEDQSRAATLWAGFLWRVYRRERSGTHRAWLAIHDCCQHLFTDTSKRQRVLFELLPERICDMAERDRAFTDDMNRLSAFAMLPLAFPDWDTSRVILEDKFRRLAPRLVRA